MMSGGVVAGGLAGAGAWLVVLAAGGGVGWLDVGSVVGPGVGGGAARAGTASVTRIATMMRNIATSMVSVVTNGSGWLAVPCLAFAGQIRHIPPHRQRM
jgi:hypothetical protein